MSVKEVKNLMLNGSVSDASPTYYQPETREQRLIDSEDRTLYWNDLTTWMDKHGLRG
jgi:hypothetical protein